MADPVQTNGTLHPSVVALPMASGIYMLTNSVTGKRYVGQAKNIRYRWYWHRNAARAADGLSYKCRTAIARAMRKYGPEQFSIEILELCSQDIVDDREIHWIAAKGTLHPAGYNLTSGGKPARRVDDVGARISAANKGRRKTPEWRENLRKARLGKKLSAETRAKISEVQRGRKQAEESIEKRRAALIGIKRRPRTDEEKVAIKAGMTPEGRARTIAAGFTPEAIEKRRQKALGQKRTPEQCERIRLGTLAAWERKREALANV